MGFVYHSNRSNVKESDQLTSIIMFSIAAPQCLISQRRQAGNITEAPLVADEARRCWRKTRSIAPAPRAIGDYVLRGLNGLLCKPHEPALVQAPARLRANVPSCLLSSTSYVLRRGVRGVSGRSPEFAFLLQAFSFSNKKKMPKRGEYISFNYST